MEEGSISDDPLFVNPAARDYHLLPISPCIRSGWPNAQMPEVDIDLEPFPLGRRPDIGADQFVDSDRDLMPVYWEGKHLRTIDALPEGDFDSDGLSNLDELWNRCDPANVDTDADGLNDGFEVHELKTNPNDVDTDDDGVSDGDELFAGTDPLDPNSLFRVEAILPEQGRLDFLITWFAVPGGTYRLHFSPDLASWQPMDDLIVADGPIAAARFKSHGTVHKKFFRVEFLP